MARSAAAAAPRRSPSRAGTRERPARRASGRGGAQAQRNAAAIKRSAAAQRKPAAAKAAQRKPASGRTPHRKAAAAKAARGPARPPAARRPALAAPGGALALPLPLRVATAPFTRALRGRGGGVLDALLHGRGWIGLIFVLLAGIVFFNVDLLKLNRDIAATAQQSSAIARENASLRLRLAKLNSSERIQTAAAQRGLLLPAPGDVRYLEANPILDGRRAAKLVEAPDAAVVAPAPVPQAAAPAAPATPPTATSAPAAAPQPAAGATAPAAGTTTAPGPGTTTAPAAGPTTAPAG